MGKLVVNADDYGISHEVNLAVKKGIEEGIIDRTTLMVNMPFAEEAVDLARENGYLSRVGLHLNLVEGIPLTEGIKNTWLCTNGKFNGEISNKKYKTGLIKEKDVLSCIREEIETQMKKYLSWEMPLRHVDSHQHSHIKPSIFPIVYKLAGENGFDSIRLASIMPSDKPKLPVKIYKSYVNSKIKKFNLEKESHTVFPQIDIGCAFLSLRKQIQLDDGMLLKKNNIEMWFHPSIDKGIIINLYCDESFDISEITKFKRISEGMD